MDINDCTITNNSSFYNGGGIMNTGTMTVTNSTISGNYAYTYGGGIYNTGTMTLSNDTISGNAGWGGTGSYPEHGGGIDNSGTLDMANTIVAGNTTTGTGVDINGTVAVANNSLIGTTAGFSISGGSNDQTGVASGLVALASNGGPTNTQALGTGSLAIAHGGAVTTVGSGGIAAAGNSITLTNGAYIGNMSGLAIPIRIDSEQMLVTAVSGNTVTVVRGYNGTTAATHASGASVYFSLDQRGYAISTTTTTPDIGAYQSAGTAPSTPTVTGDIPSAGPPAGGTTVTITGTNLSNATAVEFGGVPGTIVSDSGTAIVAITSAAAAGTVDTTVTTAGWDTSATSSADQYKFGPTYADGLSSGVLTITQEATENTGNLSFSLSGGNYTFTDTSGFLFDTPTGRRKQHHRGRHQYDHHSQHHRHVHFRYARHRHERLHLHWHRRRLGLADYVNTGMAVGDQVNVTGAVLDSGGGVSHGQHHQRVGIGLPGHERHVDHQLRHWDHAGRQRQCYRHVQCQQQRHRHDNPLRLDHHAGGELESRVRPARSP